MAEKKTDFLNMRITATLKAFIETLSPEQRRTMNSQIEEVVLRTIHSSQFEKMKSKYIGDDE